MSNYWDRVLRQRLSRRRALAVTGSSAAAAAFLAACGDDDDGGGASPSPSTGGTGSAGTGSQPTGSSQPTGAQPTGGQASGLIATPEDTSSEARRGGTVNWHLTEPSGLEPHAVDQISLNTPHSITYSHLIREKPGYMGPPEFSEYESDLAEEWEISPDNTTLTFKIRQDVKFHNKPPVSNRTLDVEDIIFSWNRYAERGAYRGVYANTVNPAAPIQSITATDDSTIVVQLAFPAVDIYALLAAPNSARFGIIPKEADGGFDPSADIIGTGPFVLDSWEPSVRMVYTRNPDYWDERGRPYVDQLDGVFLPDYASGISQFQAGNLDTYNVLLSDILALKQAQPDLLIYEQKPTGFGGGSARFGWRELGGEPSPFQDVRVRQAFSLALDRDAWIDAFYEVQELQAAGIPMERFFFSAMSPGSGTWWLDPQGSDFGDNAKYFEYNVEEGRKLMEAAGLGDGLDVDGHRVMGLVYGPAHHAQIEAMDGMIAEIGIRSTPVDHEYSSEFIPQYREGKGDYEGFLYTLAPSPANDAVSYFASRFHSAGADFLGFNDPRVDQEIDAARQEFDIEARHQLLFELQRYLGEQQWCVSFPGQATGYRIAWPVLRNFNVEQGDQNRSAQLTQNHQGVFDWWIDDTLPPRA